MNESYLRHERPVAPALGELAGDWCGQYVGYVHIPKTAGTSVTAALTNAVGVLPLVLLNEKIGTPDSRWNAGRSGFWPLITSHMAVSRFPGSHSLISTVREPRSRLLSSFRHFQRHRDKAGLPATSIVDFIKDGSFDLMASYFLTPGLWARSNIISMNPGVTADLAQGLGQLTAMSWSDDTQGIEEMIASVTGRRVQIPKLNVADQVHKHALQVSLDDLTREASVDVLLLDVAEAMGLLPKRNTGWSDDYLERTAIRLNVEFV